MKVTQGEWKVGKRKTNGVDGYEINYGEDGECITDHVYTLADAKLIAAAPELLKAIKYYFDVLREARGEDWDKMSDHVVTEMMNAVNKATK